MNWPRLIISKIGKRTAATTRQFRELSFADRLNCALFCLTIISLAISLWSVHVAIVTLTEARAGGEKQQKTLDASKDALFAAKSSLDASTTLLKGQVTIQNNTLAAVRQADSLLNEASIAASSQVQLLKSINEQPSRRGILAISMVCSDPTGRQQRSPTDMIGKTENVKFHGGRGHSTYAMKMAQGTIYSCTLTVRNIGDQKIEQFELQPFAAGISGLEVSDSDPGDRESWSLFWGEDLPGGQVGPPPFFTFRGFGGTLLPLAQDSRGQATEFRLRLRDDHLQTTSQEEPALIFQLAPVNVPHDSITVSIVRER